MYPFGWLLKDCADNDECWGEVCGTGGCVRLVCGIEGRCRALCRGGSTTCCSQGIEGYCQEGEGPCKSDDECEGELPCGTPCWWDENKSCCGDTARPGSWWQTHVPRRYTQCPLIRDSVNLRLVCPKIWLKIWLVVSHSCPIYFVFTNGYFDLYMYSSKRGIYQIDMFHFNFDFYFYPYALFMIHTTTITEWWNFKRRMIVCPKVWNCETRLSLIYPKK